MSFGICHLSIVPCRKEASDTSEMVTQLLFGEHYQILERQKKWTFIRIAHDGYECWVDNKQISTLSNNELDALNQIKGVYSAKPIQSLNSVDGVEHNIYAGSRLLGFENDTIYIGKDEFLFQGDVSEGDFKNIESVAMSFINSPYLWGGRTIAGIDCSGFSQIVYRLSGIDILRDASQQAKQGVIVSALSESALGDLAFFDNQAGRITHVGIVLKDKNGDKKSIIHASGKVRINTLDKRGIFNEEMGEYTHNLCLIKRYTNI